MDVLVDDYRFQPDLHDSARTWIGRHAAPDLHVSGSARLGLDEHGLDDRRVFHDGRVHSSRMELGNESDPWKIRRR